MTDVTTTRVPAVLIIESRLCEKDRKVGGCCFKGLAPGDTSGRRLMRRRLLIGGYWDKKLGTRMLIG